MSDRLALIEKIGEVVQKIVNPPQVSEQAQKWQEALQIMRQLNDLAKDIAMQDASIKSLAAVVEALDERTRKLQAFVLLSYVGLLVITILFFLFR
ncbi:MAG: hypothetical protein QXW40_08190 [Thermofilum sp.]